jgi:hypothetical protein
MERDTFCIIVPYASSHHLVDLLTPRVQLIVLDEAHHMAGVVMSEERQEKEAQKHIGITRSLMKRAVDLHIKRLSLTFTPRILYSDGDLEFMSMDNAAIFGRPIAELNLRKLIQQGILPDYRIWTLRDEARAGTGVIGMAECLLEAWGVTELVRNTTLPYGSHAPRMEQPLLHHMIIFAATNEEAAHLTEHLRERLAERLDDTLVLCVKGGQPKETTKAIRDFEAAPRAILVNCRVLGEGVDIPTANAVAITYAKHAMGDITQMILRPGRWYTGKPLFHMLFPILDDEDMSGFQNVLTALASCDTSIRDEILLRYPVAVALGPEPGPAPAPSAAGESVERILMDDMDGTDLERIRACFQRTRQAVFSSYDSRQIQALCVERGVDTSVEYHTVLRPYTDLPEDPRPRSVTWYDYLHPHTGRMAAAVPMTRSDFVRNILEAHSLATRPSEDYTKWREVQPASVRDSLPSVQHIIDGYFGADHTLFDHLLVRHEKSKGRR